MNAVVELNRVVSNALIAISATLFNKCRFKYSFVKRNSKLTIVVNILLTVAYILKENIIIKVFFTSVTKCSFYSFLIFSIFCTENYTN